MSYIYSLFGIVLNMLNAFTKNYALSIVIMVIGVRLFCLLFDMIKKKEQKRSAARKAVADEIYQKCGGDKNAAAGEIEKYYEESHYNPLRTVMAFCIPIILNIIVLCGMVGAVYHPLTYLTNIEQSDITKMIDVLQDNGYAVTKGMELTVINHYEMFENIVSHDTINELQNMNGLMHSGIFNFATIPNIKDFNIYWSIPITILIVIVIDTILKARTRKRKQITFTLVMTLTEAITVMLVVFRLPCCFGVYFLINKCITLSQTIINQHKREVKQTLLT